MRYRIIKECKKCKSEMLVRHGKQEGLQRYKCKECISVFRDSEPKYSPEFKMEVVSIYLNSINLKSDS